MVLGVPVVSGARLRIPLLVATPADFSSLDAVVVYDPTVLSCPRVRRSASGRAATLAANAPTPGRLLIALANGRPMIGGTVASLEFRVADGALPEEVVLESAEVQP